MITTVFLAVGYYAGRKDQVSEQNVVLAKDGKPWQGQQDPETAELFKYKVCF